LSPVLRAKFSFLCCSLLGEDVVSRARLPSAMSPKPNQKCARLLRTGLGQQWDNLRWMVLQVLENWWS
jgi:hypothetical protein